MKKVLSILLVMALVATLFAGCGEDPTATPGVDSTPNTEASGTPVPDGSKEPGTTTSPSHEAPVKDPKTEWESGFKAGDPLMEFVVYDTASYYCRWDNGAKAKLAEFGLKLGGSISAVMSDSIGIGNYTGIQTATGRKAYLNDLGLLFMEESTTPDFMPVLFASNVGSGAAFKNLGENGYLVDLNPFIEEGGALENYMSWLWNHEDRDRSAEWDNAVKALWAQNGELFAIPRFEYMPTKNLLGVNTTALAEVGVNWEDVETFEDLEDAMEAYTADGTKIGFAFNKQIRNISSVLTPIANAYGIDFSLGFDWMEKNGEPIFSYYMPEYREVLTKAVEYAQNGYVANNNGVIAYANDLESWDVEEVELDDDHAKNAMLLYGESWHMSFFDSANDRGWVDKAVAYSGYDAAITAESIFDYSYIAFTTKSVTGNEESDYELVLRMMDYVNYCCTKDAYFNYQFGKEGLPFADSWDDAGNFIYVEHEGKQYIRWIQGDRYNMFDEENKDNATPLNGGRAFWLTVHPLFAWLFDAIGTLDFNKAAFQKYIAKGDADSSNLTVNTETWNFNEAYDITKDSYLEPSDEFGGKSMWDYYADGEYLAENGITESGWTYSDGRYNTYSENTKLWMMEGWYMRAGMDMFADVTAFPMQYTAYCFNESQYRDYPRLDTTQTQVEGTNSMIYKGFFPAANEVLTGKEATDMQKKIDQLSDLARSYTITVLTTGNLSGWNDYVKSLEETGIQEVYEFYKACAFTFVTNKVEGTKTTMSDALAK